MSERSDRLVAELRAFGLGLPGAHGKAKAPRKLVKVLDSRQD